MTTNEEYEALAKAGITKETWIGANRKFRWVLKKRVMGICEACGKHPRVAESRSRCAVCLQRARDRWEARKLVRPLTALESGRIAALSAKETRTTEEEKDLRRLTRNLVDLSRKQ